MALIGRIRENTVFVLVFIGLGIALFIMMDIMTGKGNLGGGGPLKMGEVSGMDIDRQDFERTLSTVYSGGDAYQNREALWNFHVNEAMLKREAEQLGLGVSSTELRDLEFGPVPSPVIQRNFGDPQTGQINRQLLSNIQNYLDNDNIEGGIQEGQLSPNFIPIWSYQRREILAQRLQDKMTALVSKGTYAPSWMAQSRADAQTQTLSAAMVKIPFDAIDTDVSVSDDDILAYMKENRANFFNKEEQRQLSYVAIDVVPTTADSAAIREVLNQIKASWPNDGISEDSLTAIANNGTFVNAAVGRSALNPSIADIVFDEMTVGDIYGPYLEGNAYTLAKLVSRETLADSVNTRHILIAAQTPSQFATAEARVDSLIQVLQSNGKRNFGELAAQFSEDPGSKDKGGLYEGVTPGQFVKPFDDVIFRTGEPGKLYSVRTTFGVHLIELLRRSASSSQRVKVAYARESIVPSPETEDAGLEKAQLLLADNNSLEKLQAAVANDPSLMVRQSSPITVNSYQLPELGNNSREIRDIACWAFSASKGKVSPQVYTFTDPALFYESKHVIVGLSDIIPEGLPTVAAVRADLTPVVGNRLKGKEVAAALAGKDLASIAAQYGVGVDTLNNLNLTMTNLPGGAGREPKVVAAAFATATQTTSKPVIGETGVFVLSPLSAPASGQSGNMPSTRSQIHAVSRQQVSSQLVSAMRANLVIDDRRSELDCAQ